MLRIPIIFFVAFFGLAPAHSQTPSTTFAMCEDDGCSLWQFQGQQATGAWQDGAIGQMTIARFDPSLTGAVTIQRRDTTGAAPGLTATYSGTRNGNFIDGDFTWSRNGAPAGHGHWLGVFLQDPLHPLSLTDDPAAPEPAYFNSCEFGNLCGIWNLNGTHAIMSGNEAALARLTIEHFGQRYVAIRRNEVGGPYNGAEDLHIGMVKGNTIDGLFVSILPGKKTPDVNRWTVAVPAAPAIAATLSSPHSDFTGQIGMCEDTGGCSLWTFKNGRGTGVWRNGGEAQLVIDHLDANSIAVNRLDTSGIGLGISARYEAPRHGDWIEGTLTWDWPGHGPGKTAFRGAFQSFSDHAVAANAAQLPRHLLVCDAAQDCNDWSLRGATGQFRSADSGSTGTLTVQSFDDSHIAVRAHDDTGPSGGADAIWYGQRHGNLITGVASWQWPGHGENSSGTTSWHGTIESLPTFTAAALTAPKPYNLIGLWTPDGVRRDRQNFYEFAQYGTELHVLRPSPQDPQARFTWFVSNQLAAKKITGLSLAAGAWSADEITLRDPDHIFLKDGTLLVRTTVPIRDDVPCDKENSAGVDGPFAYERSQTAFAAKNTALAFCWASISAKEQDLNGALSVAFMYHEAIGTPQDYAQAFHWIAFAASHNNVTALNVLAGMYDKGEGTSKDPAKAQQVRDALSRMQGNALWSSALQGNSWQSEMLRGAVGGIVKDTLDNWGKPDCYDSLTHPGRQVCNSF